MAREKKPVHKVVMTEGKRNIIQQLLQEYDIQTAEDIQDALKDLLGGTIKEMMEAEMDDHLGYGKSERSDNDDYRNGYKSKRINSSYGSMDIQVPQDRHSTFQPQVVKKRQKDISDIDQKIISMYAKGMTTRQISDTLEDIYGFEASEGFISDVTDKILPQIEDWQNRPLSEVYQDGFTICQELRRKTDIPIILLTSRSTDYDELYGLNIGADDFVTKPYHPQILIARIQKLLQHKNNSQNNSLLCYKGLEVDLLKATMSYEGKKEYLTKNELGILRLLILNKVYTYQCDVEFAEILKKLHIKKTKLFAGR